MRAVFWFVLIVVWGRYWRNAWSWLSFEKNGLHFFPHLVNIAMLSFKRKNQQFITVWSYATFVTTMPTQQELFPALKEFGYPPKCIPERSGRLLVLSPCLLLSPISLCAYPLTLFRLEKKEKGMGAVVELRQTLVWMGSGALWRSRHSSFPVREGSVNLNRGFGIHMDQFCFLSRLRAPSKESKSCTLMLVLQKSSVGWKNLWNYILVPWWHCE